MSYPHAPHIPWAVSCAARGGNRDEFIDAKYFITRGTTTASAMTHTACGKEIVVVPNLDVKNGNSTAVPMSIAKAHVNSVMSQRTPNRSAK